MTGIDPKGHDPKLVAALASLVKRLEATPEELRGPFLVDGLKPYFPAQSLRSQAGESEAVAWQRRLMNPIDDVNGVKAGVWGRWKECSIEQAEHAIRTGRVEGYSPPLHAEARPLYARPAPIEITETMVELAERAYFESGSTVSAKEAIRTALQAALSKAKSQQEGETE